MYSRNTQDSAETHTPFRKHKATMEKMLRSVRLCMRRYEDNVIEWPQYFSLWVHSRKWKVYDGYKMCALYGHCWSEGNPGCLSTMPEFPLLHPSPRVLLELPHPNTPALPAPPLPHPSSPVLASTGHLLNDRKMLMLLLSVLVEIVLVVDQT